MKKFLILTSFLFAVSGFLHLVHGQNADYRIFGKITTVDNRSVTGYITWGKSKMYWIDIFRATKISNPYAVYFRDGQVKFMSNGYPINQPPNHFFSCRFGNIKSIRLIAYNKIELMVRDGHAIELKRGDAYDIGASLTVANSAGNTVVKWEKISKVEFMPAGKTEEININVPITGFVKTSQGIYKGFVTWDQDERTQESLLDGRDRFGEKSIPFSHIKKIVRMTNSCVVTLADGNEIELWGSNDVNSQNRGISVNMPGIGNVIIPWRNFEEFEAVSIRNINTLSYNDFEMPQRLKGQVKTHKGTVVSGYLAYDLDEAMNFEILEGKNDNITYEIPFRNITSVEPKNYKYSFITLTDKSALSLGDLTDVDENNSGVLVYPAEGTPVYIAWKEIEQIVFDK